MNTVLPRWEWRTFRTTFGDAEARIRAHPGQVTTSREIHIVADGTNASTRIHGQQLEIDELQETNRETLERWRPVINEPFPIGAATVRAAFRLWAIPPPALKRDTYSMDEFLDEIVSSQPSLRLVHVRSQRHTFTIDDCVVEIAELTFNGMPLRTIGVEMFDPARVTKTVRSLGLDRYENVSFVKSLRRFLAADAPGAQLPQRC
ncbi:MAG: hypothetical protein ACM3SQ_12885 [Betaproteobacteria bacterium]